VSAYFTDRLGSVVDVQSFASGALVNHVDYTSYGVRTDSNAGAGDGYGYTGAWSDTNTGLVRDQRRWYDPLQGRWITQDPIGFAGGLSNLYGYVGNNPTNELDPTGLAWFWERYGFSVDPRTQKLKDGDFRRVFEELTNGTLKDCNQLRDLAQKIRTSDQRRGQPAFPDRGHAIRIIQEHLLYAVLQAALVRECGGDPPPELHYDTPPHPTTWTIPNYITDALTHFGIDLKEKNPKPEPGPRLPHVSPWARDPSPCIRCHPWDGRYGSSVPSPISKEDRQIILATLGVTAGAILLIVCAAPLVVPAGAAAGGTIILGEVSATSGIAAALFFALKKGEDGGGT
jgi:RHS repeat-associated protein